MNSLTQQKKDQNDKGQNKNTALRDNQQRGSFYKSHQDYFEKLQKQLIHKSNFYTNIIGQSISNKSYKWNQDNKPSICKQQIRQQQQQQFQKNQKQQKSSHYFVPNHNNLRQKSFNLHQGDKNNNKKTYENDTIYANTSLQNLHNKVNQLNNSIKLQNRQKIGKKQGNSSKKQKQIYLKSNIEKIKQILKFSTSPIHQNNTTYKSRKVAKHNLQSNSQELQLQRNFAYNFTFQNNYPSFIEDSPQKKSLKSSNLHQKKHKINLNSSQKRPNHRVNTQVIYRQEKNKFENNLNLKKRFHEEAISGFAQNNFVLKSSKKNAQQNMQETITTKTSLFSNENQQKNHSYNIQLRPIETQIHGFSRNYKQKYEKPINRNRLNINQFLILGLLGEGKIGKVYVAKHLKTNFLCAIKIIQKQFLTEAILFQLIREIKIQSFLDHPNIVQLYSFFSDEKCIYLMLQLCFSGNLYTYLRRQNKLQEAKVKEIIKQVCNALQYMHENDILHRDLKPQNIVFHQSVIKLCDFGWSIHSNLLRDTLCGTPIYSCPEIIQKKQYDNKIDIWNVGILTYQLIIGRVPFQIRFEQDLCKIVNEEIYFPKSAQISKIGKNFVLNCLKRNRHQRYSIAQLIDHPFIGSQ